MKNLFLFIFTLALAKPISAQIKVTDFTEPELKGRVKRVTEFTWRSDRNETNVDTTKNAEKTVKTFDSSGRELSCVEFYKNGDLLREFSYKYLGDTVVTRIEYFEGHKAGSCVFKYDRNGRETVFDTFIGARKKPYSDYYKYDNQGNIVEDDTEGYGDIVPKKTIFIYNNKNQKVESDSYLFNGKLNEKASFKYDNSGRQTEVEVRDLDGQVTTLIKSSYDNIDPNTNWLLFKSVYNSYNAGQFAYLEAHIVKRVIEYF